jgi:hypothetical protein
MLNLTLVRSHGCSLRVVRDDNAHGTRLMFRSRQPTLEIDDGRAKVGSLPAAPFVDANHGPLSAFDGAARRKLASMTSRLTGTPSRRANHSVGLLPKA